MNIPKRYLYTFIFLLLLTTHFATVNSQFDASFCSNQTNYTISDQILYRANRNTLLRFISSNIGDTGFYHTSVGQANGIGECRADIQPAECRRCAEITADEILQQCPTQTQAIRWGNYCMLRYSNEVIFETLQTTPARCFCDAENTTSPDEFKRVLITLMDELGEQAAKGSSLRKAAAESRALPDNQTIYAMMQCTADLSVVHCTRCLVAAARQIRESCANRRGARIFMPSCYVRFEIYPFYHITVPTSGKNGDNTTRKIIIIVISTSMGILLALCTGIFTIKRIKQKTKENPDSEAVDNVSAFESIQFDFGQIRAATNNFSDANKLGQGGFGSVYKGKLVNGREIAVKRLSRNSGQGVIEFKNEVLLVTRLQHRNLVRLLGFSIEGNERLLVYEFHSNGSLDNFIFDRVKSSNLSWEMRYKIIGGIARGLLYLHEDSRLRIIHRDLKASNVLLDEQMNPKISDFGMAKLIKPDVTQESTSKVVGTHGYIAPEYAIHGEISIKSDVYSFGVLLLEILSGQKKVRFQNEGNLEDLLSYAWRRFREGSTTNLIDPALFSSLGNHPEILICIHIALLCVQENATNRPPMASVVLMLSSFSLNLPLPSEPAFYVPTSFSKAASLHQGQYNSREEPSSSSKMKVAQGAAYSLKSDYSITTLSPR